MSGPATRAGMLELEHRDIDGLVLCAEHAAAPFDLLAAALGVQPARLREIMAKWRRVGYAATGRLGPGPGWCWLTPSGMADTGLGYQPGPPRPARLAHLRAVLAARLWLQGLPALDWDLGRPWWQSERRIRRKGPAVGTHHPDAEIWWPAETDSPYAGEVWAIEVELTAKHATRTEAIMTALTTAGYARVLYVTAPAARPVVAGCAAALPAGLPATVTVHDLPPAAYAPEAPPFAQAL